MISISKPPTYYFTGRFADWEYYNRNVAIKAAREMCGQISGMREFK